MTLLLHVILMRVRRRRGMSDSVNEGLFRLFNLSHHCTLHVVRHGLHAFFPFVDRVTHLFHFGLHVLHGCFDLVKLLLHFGFQAFNRVGDVLGHLGSVLLDFCNDLVEIQAKVDGCEPARDGDDRNGCVCDEADGAVFFEQRLDIRFGFFGL
jgi:hypothetical protein